MHLLYIIPAFALSFAGLSLIKVWWEHFASPERSRSRWRSGCVVLVYIVCLIHRPSIFTFSHPDVYERCQEFNLLILLWLYLHEKRFPLSAIIFAECRVPSAMLPTKSSICWDQIGPSSIRIRIRIHSYIVKLSLCSQSSPELRMTSNKYTYDTSSDGSSAISFELLKNCGTAHARIIVPNTINSASSLGQCWASIEVS